MSKTPKLTEDDIRRILEAVNEAYKQAGKEIKTAVLSDENGERLLIDKRKEEELN